MSVGCGRLGGLPLLGVPLTIPGQQVVSMTETTSPLVMVKRFGVSLAEAQRVQALLRLGVTEQDVQIAERLMSSTPSGEVDHVSVSRSSTFLPRRDSVIYTSK